MPCICTCKLEVHILFLHWDMINQNFSLWLPIQILRKFPYYCIRFIFLTSLWIRLIACLQIGLMDLLMTQLSTFSILLCILYLVCFFYVPGVIPVHVSGVIPVSVFLLHLLLFNRAAHLAKISKLIMERSSSKDFYFKRLWHFPQRNTDDLLDISYSRATLPPPQ